MLSRHRPAKKDSSRWATAAAGFGVGDVEDMAVEVMRMRKLVRVGMED